MIAYHNSVYGMKHRLKEIYQNAPNKEQRIKIQTRIEEVLNDADSWIGRRKALARLLLQKLKWARLVECNFIPEKFKGCDPDSKNHLMPYDDPENVIQKAARSCARDPSKQELIKEKIKAGLKTLSREAKERAIELKNDHERDKSEMKTHTAIMKKKIIFLCLLQGYDPDFLEKFCLSEESRNMLDKAAEYCANEKDKKEVVKKIEGLMEEKTDIDKEEKKKYKQIMKKMLKGKEIDKTSFEKNTRFLLLHGGFDEKCLKDMDFLPDYYQFDEDSDKKNEETNHKKGKKKSQSGKNAGTKPRHRSKAASQKHSA
jgi:hypothetical protein